jgi:hypothetical protein
MPPSSSGAGNELLSASNRLERRLRSALQELAERGAGTGVLERIRCLGHSPQRRQWPPR